VNVGDFRHEVAIQAPVRTVSGGTWTETWAAVSPSPVFASVRPVNDRVMERIAGNAVLAASTHVVEMRHHGNITTKCRLVFNGRYLHVRGVQNVDEADDMTRLFCEEVVE
jgi:head-tail adaptor